MDVLLDTHTLLWHLKGSPELSEDAGNLLRDPRVRCYVSDVSAWEIAIKSSLGKLSLPLPYQEIFPQVIERNSMHRLPIDTHHFHELLTLPQHHRDPFDRLLIAQAKAENLTLVSRDGQFGEYGVSVLW